MEDELKGLSVISPKKKADAVKDVNSRKSFVHAIKPLSDRPASGRPNLTRPDDSSSFSKNQGSPADEQSEIPLNPEFGVSDLALFLRWVITQQKERKDMDTFLARTKVFRI